MPHRQGYDWWPSCCSESSTQRARRWRDSGMSPTEDRSLLVSYAGVPTFMRAPLVGPEELRAGDVAIVGAPLDTGTQWRQGTDRGPAGVREHSLHLLHSLESSYDDAFVDLESGALFRGPHGDR